MHIFQNPDWTFIINFSSIFLAVLSILLTIKISFTKDIGLIHWNNYTTHEKIPDRIDLVRQIHKIQLTFQNHGKDVIYKRDIVDRINIDLKNATQIIKVLFETNCKFNQLDYSINKNTISFDFDFLEHKKYVRIHIDYYSEEKIEGNVTGKIIGGSEIDYKIETDNRWDSYYIGKKNADANYFVFPVISAVLFSLAVQVLLKMFKIDFNTLLETLKTFKKESFLIIFIVLILAGICILLALKIRKAFIPFAIFAEKEKNWYLKKEYNST